MFDLHTFPVDIGQFYRNYVYIRSFICKILFAYNFSRIDARADFSVVAKECYLGGAVVRNI